MPEDMAMLKIVNRNNTFYLESATYQPHNIDIERNEQNGKTQESMYLVVRSLKVNNEKIVSTFFVILIVFWSFLVNQSPQQLMIHSNTSATKLKKFSTYFYVWMNESYNPCIVWWK